MNSYSQFGEDALVAEIFKAIGIKNRHCFEVGAHDGRHLSNTLAFREEGWTALLAESDPDCYLSLDSVYGAESICVFKEVENIDTLLAKHSFPEDIDLVSIDVDGRDYWLWHDMAVYRPRVVIIEFSPYEHYPWHDAANPVPRDDENDPVRQTARNPTVDLGTLKGYRLAAETFCNLIFVDKSVDISE